MSFIMLTYWLVLNVVNTLLIPGIFVISDKTSLIELKSNEIYYEPVSIPQEKLFTAYRLKTSDLSITDDEIENYVVGLWFQSYGNEKL